MGGDVIHLEGQMFDQLFQSTPPVWEATLSKIHSRTGFAVSIHASRVGGDQDDVCTAAADVVSIHASRVGGDQDDLVGRAGDVVSIHASRVGGDPDSHNVSYLDWFQSTPPVWEATMISSVTWRRIPVSIHASRVGGDLSWLVERSQELLFQSTPPVWEATGVLVIPAAATVFQSTPPVWEATWNPMRSGD